MFMLKYSRDVIIKGSLVLIETAYSSKCRGCIALSIKKNKQFSSLLYLAEKHLVGLFQTSLEKASIC